METLRLVLVLEQASQTILKIAPNRMDFMIELLAKLPA